MALLKRKRSGLNDPMSVVTRFVNACNRHDADGVASCLHPDFDSIQPMYPTRNFRGADQVRRNWQAIFDAEPGFRLTVLRSATTDDTIWLELHGAGEEAEVAGVFVMGVQGDRIRWARIYSALIEPVPEGVGEPPAPLRDVSRHDNSGAAAGDGEVVEESLIAPVLDMDRGGRRRRRRRGQEEDQQPVEGEAAAQPDEALSADAEAVVMVDGDTQIETVVIADPDAEVAVEAGPETDVVVVSEDVEGSEPAVVMIAPAEDDDDGGPPTEAVDVVTVTASDDEEAATEDPKKP
jgi:ketosteroid isomerase-like protein